MLEHRHSAPQLLVATQHARGHQHQGQNRIACERFAQYEHLQTDREVCDPGIDAEEQTLSDENDLDDGEDIDRASLPDDDLLRLPAAWFRTTVRVPW